MKISVFGLGYAGSVSAAYFAEKGNYVLGADINQAKAGLINEGRAPVIEKGLGPIIARCVKSGNLKATSDARLAVLATEASFVCVGTPSLPNGSPDLCYVKRVAKDIGSALRYKNKRHLVILRSTVLPGTTEHALIPIIEKYSGKKCGAGFGAVYNPEFLRESTGLSDFRSPPFTIIGTRDDGDFKIVARLYKGIKAPAIKTSFKSAEMIKYANNTFHALKVVFANEIGGICKELGVDPFEIMDIFCLDKKLNLSGRYLKPGFAFGGACLPKDIRAVVHKAKELDIDIPVLSSVLASNALRIKYVADRITSLKKNKIGVLGIAFKAGTDDLRESPLIELIEILSGKGYSLKIYDRNVALAALHGKNKEFIEKKLPHIGRLMVQDAEEILDDCEVIIIGNEDKRFANIFSKLAKKQHVIDLVGIAKKVRTQAHYEGICW